MKNFLSLNDFSKQEIENFLVAIEKIKNNSSKFFDTNFQKSLVANIFLEPSTRTLNSFIVAENHLGIFANTIDVKNSSFQKNESLKDSILTLNALGYKYFVIRGKNNFYSEIKLIQNISIINAGDGDNEHPSQSLLDIFTIYEYCKEHKKTFKDLKVLIIGDLKNSRVYGSNQKAFEKMGMEVFTCSPKELMPKSVTKKQISSKLDWNKFDVVMFLRVQFERHDGINFKMSNDEYNKTYGLNIESLKHLKKDAIFMHPGPINLGIEISEDVAYSSQSKILQQVNNGVYTRMAILLYVQESLKI